MELCLVIRHNAHGAVFVEVPGHLREFEAELGDLLHRELEQGLVVGLEVDLAAFLQNLPVELQKVPVGQAAFGVALAGPGIAEVDVDPVHFAGGEEVGQLVGVGVHEEHIVQPLPDTPLHGHHHGVRHHFHGDEEHIRLCRRGPCGKAALSAAQLHPQFPGSGHQFPPLAPPVLGIPDQAVGTPLHPGDQIFLFPHAHARVLLGSLLCQIPQEIVVACPL